MGKAKEMEGWTGVEERKALVYRCNTCGYECEGKNRANHNGVHKKTWACPVLSCTYSASTKVTFK